MKSHLRSIAKKKATDFLLREEGMVGNRSAFATAAFVSATSLATFLVVSPDAKAAGWCGNDNLNCALRCCWNHGFGANAAYHCVPEDVEGWHCWSP